jgi:quercetin dioxygenase-like cupin family protein
MIRLPFLLLLCSLFTTVVAAQDTAIFPRGEKAENVHHKGEVWLYHPGETDEAFDYGLAVATFAPDARLDWHSHPAGQQLIITAGTGYYQERGKELKTVRKGDVVNCLPGVEHWHASTPDSGVTYLAITGDEPTQWLEPVADEVYYGDEATSGTGSVEQELLELSKQKWQWMADKDADKLAELFHDQAMFVHMGGSWGKEQEVNIIRDGGIHYKQADIHSASVQVIGNTAVVLNNITLLAVVGGNEVTNPFEVTEVYTKVDSDWKLASLSFTRLMTR